MLDCKGPSSNDIFTVRVKEVADDGKFRDLLAQMMLTTRTVAMTISPAMATIMLERNTGNRTLSKSRVQAYARDMTNRSWQHTGEAIIFSDCGVLNDGQTRLAACVLAGVSFLTDVRFGIKREAFKVTGTGAKRTLADVFSIQGKPNSIRLAGALNWLNKYEHGFAYRALSHVDGLALRDLHPDIEKSIEVGSLLASRTKLLEPSLAVFLHYIFALKSADKADAFFDFLRDGVGDISGKYDPRLVIRERLIANKGAKAKLDGIELAALVIKAWNSYRQRKDIRTLRWISNPSANASAEAFPRAQ